MLSLDLTRRVGLVAASHHAQAIDANAPTVRGGRCEKSVLVVAGVLQAVTIDGTLTVIRTVRDRKWDRPVRSQRNGGKVTMIVRDNGARVVSGPLFVVSTGRSRGGASLSGIPCARVEIGMCECHLVYYGRTE